MSGSIRKYISANCLQSEKYPLVIVDVNIGGRVNKEHDEELESLVIVLETLVSNRRLVNLEKV